MVDDELPEARSLEDTNFADVSQSKDEGDKYENYESSVRPEDFSEALGPDDPGQSTTENNESVEEREGVIGDKNDERNVLDLEVVPDEPPPPPPKDPGAEEPKQGEDMPRATVIYRAGWGARPSKEPPAPPLHHPIDTVIFLHTGSRAEECHDHLECSQRLQELQRVNMFEDGMPDIQYNFMVTSDNTIYEGRGWNRSGTKDPPYKHFEGKSLDICFIGDFSGRQPPDNMIKAALGIIGDGICMKYVTSLVNFCRLHSNQSTAVDFGNFTKYTLPS